MTETLLTGATAATADTGPEVTPLGEGRMVREDCWREVHRLFHAERRSKSEIARQLQLDRKTVRGILGERAWQPYARAERPDTLLAEHASFLRTRAPEVQYSARILFQELRRARGYRGSYETVKRFVRPLRAAEQAAERATVRFETPPGQQSQIDWGQAQIHFRHRPVILHVFILTLGYSRRSFHESCLGETLSQFLDAHERAFDYFGGHTREHLYDRPRTVCQPGGDGRVIWNATFKQFADYWGFEPHLCRAYRAQTKGKVESGVKYLKGNFLPGRTFVDEQDLREQLDQVAAGDRGRAHPRHHARATHGSLRARAERARRDGRSAWLPARSEPAAACRRRLPRELRDQSLLGALHPDRSNGGGHAAGGAAPHHPPRDARRGA